MVPVSVIEQFAARKEIKFPSSIDPSVVGPPDVFNAFYVSLKRARFSSLLIEYLRKTRTDRVK